MKKFILPTVLAIIALFICVLQGGVFLFFQDIVVRIMLTDKEIQSLVGSDLTPGILKASMSFVGCLTLALAAWFGLALTQFKAKKGLIHLIIPSILALVLGNWLVSFCGLLAALLYQREKKNL